MQEIPKFNQLDVPLAAKITVNGQKYLYFGGTAYLGIPQNEAFIQLYLEGIYQFGLNNGTSRNNNVQLGIYDQVEQFAAAKFGADAALVTSSGYLAAQLLVKECTAIGEIRYAPATHPALWLTQKPNVIGNFTTWAANLVQEINSSTAKNWVIISNSMNNLFPEIYDFSFLAYIENDKSVILIVDDSHGIGINNNGLGAYSSIPKTSHIEVLVIASMAKALGVDAGLVLGTERMINQLKQSDLFLGASPPAAAGLYAFMHANEIYESALNQLQVNMFIMRNILSASEGWHFVKEFPVYLAKNADLSEQLLKHNILISSFAYPDKDGPKINRIVLSNTHSHNDIEQLITALAN